MNTKYLTKSLFKLALECPTKLFYYGKSEYKNEQEEDAFLEALKDGGYQVGALAKAYIGEGVDLADCDNQQAYTRTQELIQNDKIIIYEALFRHENLQIRCDILIKDGNDIEIIEVKSKSYDPEDDAKYIDKDKNRIGFKNTKGQIIKEWREYLLDVAFQSHVIDKVLPTNLKTKYYLMLVDKQQVCPVDGLYQKFIIKKEKENKKLTIISRPLSENDKSLWLLKKINIDNQIQELKQEEHKIDLVGMSFDAYVAHLANNYTKNTKIITSLGAKCGKCEFNCSIEEQNNNSKNGFKECWKSALKWDEIDFSEKTVLDVWKLGAAKDKLIEQGVIKLSQFSKDNLNLKNEANSLSQSARQWLQIDKYQKDDLSVFTHPELKNVMAKWKFPLHFIDFETCTPAIPLHKGRRPYEPLAFQFSHHKLNEDGSIEHIGQFIETVPGAFPNYNFVRALKRQLETDNGTIFRFHNHENNILNNIYEQLDRENSLVADKKELIDFILSITIKRSADGKKVLREGNRNMVDLEEVLRKYTFFPSTNGRTSMKVTFPTILQLSESLQKKYSEPIYGDINKIKSLNFSSWSIVEKNSNGNIADPYSRLPGVFENVPAEDVELFLKAERMREIEDIREGGIASTAYALMQFTDMQEVERNALRDSLLKYCELDTLAMVILYEFLKEQVYIIH